MNKRDRIIRRFMAFLEGEEGFGRTTMLRYRQHVRSWMVYLGTIRKPPEAATRDDAGEWWGQVRRGYSTSTQAQILSAVRKFYLWYDERIKACDNPFVRIKGPHVQHRPTLALTQEEITWVIDRFIPFTYVQARDKAITLLLYDSGLRANEVRKLNMQDVDWRNRTVEGIGKGGKPFIKPFHADVERMLKLYLSVATQEHHMVPSGPLFVGRFGNRISYDTIRIGVGRVLESVGITGRYTPHSLRKSYGTHLWQHSRDIYMVQQALGHAKVQTTVDHYIADNPVILRQMIDEAHPMARREGRQQQCGQAYGT